MKMGRKRRSDQEIQDKITRLQAKLRKRQIAEPEQLLSQLSSTYEELQDPFELDDMTPVPSPSPTPISGDQDDQYLEQSTSSSKVPLEILNVLGEAKKVGQEAGDKISEEISTRWSRILLDGLEKESKENLLGKFLIPENFQLARAPKLNLEILSILQVGPKNRDARLEKSQNQLGSGIAGLVSLTNDLVNMDVIDKLTLIKRISEISQLLLDLHHEETLNRQKLILPLLDKKFISLIQGMKRDTFLFGDKLGDSIKQNKEMERTSQHIRKQTTNNNNYQQPAQRRSYPGNVQLPPHQKLPKMVAAPAYSNHYRGQPATRRMSNVRPTRGRGKRASQSYHSDHRHK